MEVTGIRNFSNINRRLSSTKKHENVNITHRYNTRLSEKLRCLSHMTRELTVDLSNSQIDVACYGEKLCGFTNFTYEAEFPEDDDFPEPSHSELNTSTRLFYNLDDSREFSSETFLNSEKSYSSEPGVGLEKSFDRAFYRGLGIETKKIGERNTYSLMDVNFERPRPCGPRVQQQGREWKTKSMYIITLVGFVCLIYPIYCEIVRDLANMNQSFTQLKKKVDEITKDKKDIYSRLANLEYLRHEMKNTEANLQKRLFSTLEEEIGKLYGDKTGRPDFALESAGGRIIQLSHGTENYGEGKNSVFGVSLCGSMHGPRAMIHMGMAPGECWALKGSNGGAIIKLLGSVTIDAVSMEHISPTISPTGDSTTAPKDFSVWGLSSPTDTGQLLGQFVYKLPGSLVQTFTLPKPPDRTFDYVELKILSNNGHPEFTCVYRFRVHGKLGIPSTKM